MQSSIFLTLQTILKKKKWKYAEPKHSAYNRVLSASPVPKAMPAKTSLSKPCLYQQRSCKGETSNSQGFESDGFDFEDNINVSHLDGDYKDKTKSKREVW